MQEKVNAFMEVVTKMTLEQKQNLAGWIVYMFEPTGYPPQMEFKDNLIIIAEVNHDSAPVLTVKDVTEYITECAETVMELDWYKLDELLGPKHDIYDRDLRWVLKIIAAADPEVAERYADVLKEVQHA